MSAIVCRKIRYFKKKKIYVHCIHNRKCGTFQQYCVLDNINISSAVVSIQFEHLKIQFSILQKEEKNVNKIIQQTM